MAVLLVSYKICYSEKGKSAQGICDSDSFLPASPLHTKIAIMLEL